MTVDPKVTQLPLFEVKKITVRSECARAFNQHQTTHTNTQNDSERIKNTTQMVMWLDKIKRFTKRDRDR